LGIFLNDWTANSWVNWTCNTTRSILTVPWVELGGSVSITCAKTGYSASVEFLTKPFYGGRKNRITAEVFQPFDKKAFVTIAGEWNGAMVAKWADGVSFSSLSEPCLSLCKLYFELDHTKLGYVWLGQFKLLS